MKNKQTKNVAVFFGGRSCEHDISVITGVLCLNSLDRERFAPLPVYVTDDDWFTGDELFDLSFYKDPQLNKLKKVSLTLQDKALYELCSGKLKSPRSIYCAINCCHGLNGEDGCISGILQMSGIPSASPGMLASSVFMDKAATKPFLQGIGVSILPYRQLVKGAFFQNRVLALTLCEHSVGYPCIVKPARLGSSIGVGLAHDRAELTAAIERAMRYDGKVIVEKALTDFIEINCAAYRSGGRVVVSECERPISGGSILTFADKYGGGGKGMEGASRQFPADIPEELSRKIRDITALVYRKSFLCGVVRMDFLVCGEDVYLNEVNTVPGSLALYLFKEKTSLFGEVLTELIEEGIKERRDFDNGTFTYKACVFDGVSSKSGKMANIHP